MSDHTPRTIEIQLTRGRVAVVDTIDADLADLTWCAAKPSSASGIHYAQRMLPRSVGKKTWMHMHRVVLERILGRALGAGEYADHIDGNGLNNCRTNLRLATHQQNMQNRKMSKANVVGYKGVTKRENGRFRAQIKSDGKRYSLGTFTTAEEAHTAYCAAARELHGDFARFE